MARIQRRTIKDLHDPDNHDGMITHLEPNILECKVKWISGSITTNKSKGGDGIPVAAAAKSLQLCPTLCNPIDGSPQNSPVPGILEERTLQWVAISFSNAWKWKVKVKSLSRVQLFTTPCTVAYQAPPSMGFSSKSTRVDRYFLLWNSSWAILNPKRWCN